jgi:hypothetical protein
MRTSIGLAGLLVAFGVMLPMPAQAAGEIQLTFEPHCGDEIRENCPTFPIADASSLSTARMSAGDILDVDIVLTGAADSNADTVRSWLTYDSSILEGRSIELSKVITKPLPGEENIDKTTGTIKIGGNVGKITNGRVAIARVTFRVLNATKNTAIKFTGFLADGTGQTAVNGKKIATTNAGTLPAPCIGALVGCRGVTVPLLMIEPTSLTVSLADPTTSNSIIPGVAAATISSSASPETQSPTAASPTGMELIGGGASSAAATITPPGSLVAATTAIPPAGTTFNLLQVQNLRATTRDNQIFLGWVALQSAELAGYNVYYGTVTGKYIQRRTVPPTAASLVLRDLEPGTTYFFAVRAFSNSDQETVFSKEVSIVVGKPETSSSPLVATAAPLPVPETIVAPENPLETRSSDRITGDTGTASSIVIFALFAGLIGTSFAFARQYSLSHRHHAI